VLMSGSGTTVFAVCRGENDALRVARGLRPTREEWPGLRVGIVRSCD
jgi:4-diphosphocytidyl-2C-methyl-D-erythritol kinase